MKRRLLFSLFAPLLALGLSRPALADSIIFTLNNATQSSTAGKTLTYSATISAPATNTGLEYLSGVTYSISPFNSFVVNTDPFSLNYPAFLAAGGTYTGPLFTLFIPTGSTLATYLGSISIIGGPTSISQNILATQTSTTNVTPAATVTPEPSTWALLATGMLGVFSISRLRSGETL